MRLKNDIQLRLVLYELYQALFKAKTLFPQDFKKSRLTTIQTGYMSLENLGWRVVGITPEALKLLATVDFKKSKLPRRLCRGHIIDRAKTTSALFDHSKPVGKKKFFEIYLANDFTVLMLTEQNKINGQFPKYIPIQNEDGALFQNAGLMGWKHRQNPEVDFLRALYKQYRGNRIKAIRPSIPAV